MHYDQYHYTVLQTARVIVAAVDGVKIEDMYLRARIAAEEPRFADDTEIRFYTNNPNAIEYALTRDEITALIRDVGLDGLNQSITFWALRQDILDALRELLTELPTKGGE